MIDAIDGRVGNIKSRQSRQDGGISSIKYILGSIGGVVFAACLCAICSSRPILQKEDGFYIIYSNALLCI